jgi:hypothetical protein
VPSVWSSAGLENAQERDSAVIADRCSCGFIELADEEIIDHLELVFVPDGLTGNDGPMRSTGGLPARAGCRRSRRKSWTSFF